MPPLYPLLIKPEFHERPWGSRDLSPIYDYSGEKLIGEAWLTGDACTVQNGPLAGKRLGELAKEYREQLVGDAAPVKDRFPLLIKFLFPKEKLSVQVHPDDEGARRIGQPCGKTECWYVLKADPGAQVGLGLKPGTTKQQLKEAIEQTRAEELLNWIPVAAGEMIYVDAGTVHAIGPGSVLVETQQNSDTTYRLYDYGRPRQLHIEEGLAATKEKTHAGKVLPDESAGPKNLVTSPCFKVEAISAGKEPAYYQFNGAGNVHIFVVLEGEVAVKAKGHETVKVTRGGTVVVPASVAMHEIALKNAQCMTMSLPARDWNKHPRTSLETLKAVSN